MILGPVKRRSFLASFSRSQLSAATATGADFALIFVLVEFFHVWYVLATALGALVGAITNFTMNRHWSFAATHDAWHSQAARYAAVSGGSMVLNSGFVWIFTDVFGFHYAISVVMVSGLVGILFNFPLHRYYVFR